MQHLRKASPDERRYIVRQALDYYRCLIIGGIYTFEAQVDDAFVEESLTKALKHCVSVHPLLSATIIGEETEAPIWARPSTLNLENHMQILEPKGNVKKENEREHIKNVLSTTHDHIFTSRDQTPPWKVVVQALSKCESTQNSRYLVLFTYYHSHGDGKSGLVFNKTLLAGLRLSRKPDCPFDASKQCETPDMPMLPSMMSSGKLTISWSFLLTPVLGAYLPSFIGNIFGIRASATPEAENQWRGRDTFYDPQNFRSGVEMISINNNEARQILQLCRAHGAKFTGLLDQLILRTLSQEVPAEKAGHFLSQIVVDLRKHFDAFSEDDMVTCPSARYQLHPRIDTPLSKDWATSISQDPIWEAARTMTEKVAACAATTHNQPIGLLQYLTKIYPWMRGQIGKPRDGSYEISNILSLKTPPKGDGEGWDIESMLFSQPANAASSCMTFNVVSKFEGDLVIGINWQLGALDMDDEEGFVERVGESLLKSLRSLGRV